MTEKKRCMACEKKDEALTDALIVLKEAAQLDKLVMALYLHPESYSKLVKKLREARDA